MSTLTYVTSATSKPSANWPSEPTVIPGGLAVDDRGQLTFANGFSFESVRRFYMVENFSTETVRAFHGHLKEAKFAFVVAGSAILAAVPIDDPIHPSSNIKPYRYVLSDRQPRILFIPPGYANGFRPLEPKTKIMFFSSSTLEDSAVDDFRFPHDYWGPEIWNVDFR